MINDPVQIIADRRRGRRAKHHKDAARHHLDQYDAIRRTIGMPWSDMIPPWAPWLLNVALWVTVALLAWWLW